MARLIAFEELKALGIPYSKVHIWRLEKAGRFPKRVQVGQRRHGWAEDEINQHIAALIKARDRAA